jgi:hypothetical protein
MRGFVVRAMEQLKLVDTIASRASNSAGINIEFVRTLYNIPSPTVADKTRVMPEILASSKSSKGENHDTSDSFASNCPDRDRGRCS